MKKNLSVFIPALKKNVAFQDDLVKKLAGISLIQRSINKAINLCVDKSDVYILTDSEEIQLIAKRNSVRVFLDPDLVWDQVEFFSKLVDYLGQFIHKSEYILLLSPYAPLLTEGIICNALQSLVDSKYDILKPVKHFKHSINDNKNQTFGNALFSSDVKTQIVESEAFILFRAKLLLGNQNQNVKIFLWEVENDLFEINSYHDWWVCEKLITRKKIIFRVIGNNIVGMGHIYRALTLAHEITDHEVLFVCDSDNSEAVNKLAGYDYWFGAYNLEEIIDRIIEMQPDLVINDILSTTKEDVNQLHENGIKVVNFEDLGEGASLADLTINELYDEPEIAGENILWGHNYFFVRDEFHDAVPHNFNKKVGEVLLAFGGTDQHNLSSKIYHTIKDFCEDRDIHINIVTGPGYMKFSDLAKDVKGKNVLLTRSTGVISSIMEKSEIALVSNGRTVYELAHMNIPAIVISQHDREDTHIFSCKENGFLPQGIYKKGDTEKNVLASIERLINDTDYRYILHKRMERFRFDLNKDVVLKKILSLLELPVTGGSK